MVLTLTAMSIYLCKMLIYLAEGNMVKVWSKHIVIPISVIMGYESGTVWTVTCKMIGLLEVQFLAMHKL